MSDLSRHRPYLLWGLGLVGVALTVGLLLVPAGSWVALDQRRSSLRTTPDGLAAWSISLKELGVPTRPRYRSLTDDPPRGRALVLMEPILAPTPEEVHELLEWVREGGLLIHSPAIDSGVMDSVGVRLSVWSGGEAEGVDGETSEIDNAEGERAEGETDRGESPEDGAGDPRGVPPGSFAEHPWTAGLAGERDGTVWLVEPEPGAVEGWTSLTRFPGPRGDRASLAWAPVGRGGVLILSEAQDLANESLGSSPVARATSRAVLDLLAPEDTLVFSEYHQGLDGRRGLLRESLGMARESGLGRFFLHLALVGVLAFALARRGLGAPLPSVGEDRRSPREHVDALAGILRTADARRSAADRLVRGASRRMGIETPVEAGPGAPGDTVDLVERWTRSGGARGPARAALEALRSRPVDLMALSRALDAIVKTHENPSPQDP